VASACSTTTVRRPLESGGLHRGGGPTAQMDRKQGPVRTANAVSIWKENR
jgi:hypothetical protein